MSSAQWRASASIDMLKTRAKLLADIRSFFAHRDVLEVDTPALCHHTVTDVHLEAMSTVHTNPMSADKTTLYLQTSPEFSMKRLLASGSGCIYQICKSYRDDEVGARHNPEFTMLEWYRVGFAMQDLIDEVSQLLVFALDLSSHTDPIEQITYQQLFQMHLGIDPLNGDIATLIECANQHGFENLTAQISVTHASHRDTDMLLQLLFSHCLEPKLGNTSPCIVTHFPTSQAALAKADVSNPQTALRFEVYVQGIELANGYEELQDAQVQMQRMENDNRDRRALGKSAKPLDQYLIAALQNGLPMCSGVALGLDRLMMIKTGSASISDVIAFTHHNA